VKLALLIVGGVCAGMLYVVGSGLVVWWSRSLVCGEVSWKQLRGGLGLVFGGVVLGFLCLGFYLGESLARSLMFGAAFGGGGVVLIAVHLGEAKLIVRGLRRLRERDSAHWEAAERRIQQLNPFAKHAKDRPPPDQKKHGEPDGNEKQRDR